MFGLVKVPYFYRGRSLIERVVDMPSQTTTEQLLPVYGLPKIVNPELEVRRLSKNFRKHNITFTVTNGVGHCRGIFTASDSHGECVLYVLYDGYFVIPNPRIFS